MNPEHPVYIVSKGRWDTRLTARALQEMRVPFLMVVERAEYDAYASTVGVEHLLVLDPAYQRDYDPGDALGDTVSKGSGPARNFVWDHAVAAGSTWHWLMDDNIVRFYRFNRNAKIPARDGTCFRVMEAFCARYANVLMAGPNYEHMVIRKSVRPPFTPNTRIYSCNLIRNDAPYRWRCRYNEDTDLSLRMLKDGYCTVLFNAFLQNKVATQRMAGGNTDEIYANGTLAKSQMIANLHPDVARVVWKFNRWHHHVDYRPFRTNKLRPRPDVAIPAGVDNFGMQLVHI